MNKQILTIIMTFGLITSALAGDGAADSITSLDGDGNGTFPGVFTDTGGTGSVHPWYTFEATAGTTVTIMLNSDVDTTMWVFDVTDNNAEVGDMNGVDINLSDNGGSSTANTLSFIAPTTGQFAIQIDSYFGSATVNYTLIVSGANGIPTAVPTLQQWALILLAALIIAVVAPRLSRRFN